MKKTMIIASILIIKKTKCIFSDSHLKTLREYFIIFTPPKGMQQKSYRFSNYFSIKNNIFYVMKAA